MDNLKFDLEEAELSLHNIENLIKVYADFIGKHCAPGTEQDKYTRENINIYYSVILAALETIKRLRDEMKKSIKNQLAERKYGKG